MFLKVFLLCFAVFGIAESAIWNIPKEFATTKNSTWCNPRGGKWDTELTKCACNKNYYGTFCEKIKSCRYGLMMNFQCHCFYGWKGEACDQINCKFGIAVNNKCVCNSGISGTFCDSCLTKNQNPPNCLIKNNAVINEDQQSPGAVHQQQCSTNLINYYLNIILLILITIYFTINRILKRRENMMQEQLNSRPILTPEMEALLLAKTHIDPDFIPCPRYDEILHSYPINPREEPITVLEESSPNEPVRIISLHV